MMTFLNYLENKGYSCFEQEKNCLNAAIGNPVAGSNNNSSNIYCINTFFPTNA
jgi:hypothetical protein